SEIPDATPGSLAWGWRHGDPETLDALAEAELERLGLDFTPLGPPVPTAPSQVSHEVLVRPVPAQATEAAGAEEAAGGAGVSGTVTGSVG
ncbi:hypothetical protein G3I28_03695, partial [Streptomyces sp. SID10116]|nr:hypothetical protein [Streptomyces sp. SID10116]